MDFKDIANTVIESVKEEGLSIDGSNIVIVQLGQLSILAGIGQEVQRIADSLDLLARGNNGDLAAIAAALENPLDGEELAASIKRAEFDTDEMTSKRCATGFHDDCTGQVAGTFDCECACHAEGATVGADAA